MKRRRFDRTTCRLALIAALAPCVAAAAQLPAPTPPPATSAPATPADNVAAAAAAPNGPPGADGAVKAASSVADTSTRLGEIVVTAQKRVERLQDVPISVVALSGAQLAAAGVTDTLALTTVTPGLTIRTLQGSFQPTLRGVGTSSSVVENPVGLYIDGVYLPQQREGLRELNDLAQIAVLKGPQGTLFGRNSTGGVIQITTRTPSHTFQGDASAELDNYLTGKLDLYVTGGLTDTLAASLTLATATQGIGWGDDPATGHDTYKLEHQNSIRSKFLWNPDSKTDVTLILDYLDRRQRSNSYQAYPGTSSIFPGVQRISSPYDSDGGVDGLISFHGGGASVQIDHDFGFARLVSITSYRRGAGTFQFDNSAAPGAFFVVKTPNAVNEDYTQEVQLVSAKGRFNWVTGVFYIHSLNGIEPIIRNFKGPVAPAPTSNAVTTTFGDEVAESVAPFAQADYEILPKTRLTFGARYTYEDRSLTSSVLSLRNNGSTLNQVFSGKTDIYKTTVRAALDHSFTDDVSGYLSYNTGIKSGGFNILNPANPAYLPEELTSYEVGVKSELFNRRARLNLAGFYYDYTNIQVIQFTSGIQTIVNGAGAELYGLDLDFEAQVMPGLRVSGGLELEHSEFTSYPAAVFSTPRPTGGAVLFTGDAKGKRLPLAQEVSGNIAIDYHRSLTQGALDFNVTTNYAGQYYFEPDNFLQQKPYVLLNASIKYTLPNSRYSLTLWGRNLVDYAILSQPTTQAVGYPAPYANAPRTFGFTGRASF